MSDDENKFADTVSTAMGKQPVVVQVSEVDHTKDWPPRVSALGYVEGYTRRGSTGQLWMVQDKRWVRLVPRDRYEYVSARKMMGGEEEFFRRRLRGGY